MAIRGYLGGVDIKIPSGMPINYARITPVLPTDTAIANARPTEKAARIFSGGGPYVEIAPAGGKLWPLK